MNDINIKKSILTNTMKAIKNTKLSIYYKESDILKILNSKIKFIEISQTFNYEKTRFTNGVLSVDSSFLYESNNENKQIILASYGLYCLISDTKKYNPVNDSLASYFSSLGFRGRNIINVKTLVGDINTFINHNIPESQHLLILDNLIGEENIAYLFSKIDLKHSFYDNLSYVFKNMDCGFLLEQFSSKKMEKSILKYNSINNDLVLNAKKYYEMKQVYSKYIKFVREFEKKYSFNEFEKFIDDIINSKFLVSKLKNKYNISLQCLYDIDRVSFSMFIDMLEFSMENFPLNYQSYYDNCIEKMKFMHSYALIQRDKSRECYSDINTILISDIIKPLAQSNKIDVTNIDAIETILDTKRVDEETKTDKINFDKVKQYYRK